MADNRNASQQERRNNHHISSTSQFPSHHHLLIATRHHIHNWSRHGLLEILYQERGGIVSAQEAGDGTGLLAVAAGLVVLLGDIYGKTTQSWNLRGAYDHVTLIRFANNYEELFYSTCLQNSIIQYSIAENRILSYSCLHPSPPTAFAVSMSSKYLISASATPPTLYLQVLLIPSTRILIRPHASESCVTAAQFHPLRENIFLLAYEDGTVSVHTVSRILLMRDTSNGSDGSLGHLSRSHRHRNHLGTSIVAAAFMSGYPLRLVTVTGDGKCRIIDFKRGATILRTWRAEGACTGMSIASFDDDRFNYNDEMSRLSPETPDYDVERKHIIALGRANGYVDLYDGLGLFLDRKLIDAKHGPIVDLDWVSESEGNGMKAHFTSSGVGDIPHVDWVYASPLPYQVNDENSEVLMMPNTNAKPIGRSKQNLVQTNQVIEGPREGDLLTKRKPVSSTTRFRPRRSPQKPPNKHKHLDKLPDSPHMPGAWISSSDSSASMYTARTSPDCPLESSKLPQRREASQWPESTARSTSFPRPWLKAFQSPIPLSAFPTRASKSGNQLRQDYSHKMSKTIDSMRGPTTDESKNPKSLHNTEHPAQRRRLSGLIGRKPWAVLSQPDGAGSHEIECIDIGTVIGTKKSTTRHFDAHIPSESPMPRTPPCRLLQSSPAGSSPTTLPSLASLAQRLRLSSSAADEALTDEWVSVSQLSSGGFPISSFTSPENPPGMNPLGFSPNSDKPLPAPPLPSADLPMPIDDSFASAQALGPHSAALSPALKPLPVLPNSETENKEWLNQDTCSFQDVHYKCACECAELLREQLGLIRGEMASLRKAIWCFGSGTGWGRLVERGPDVEATFACGNVSGVEVEGQGQGPGEVGVEVEIEMELQAQGLATRTSEERAEWERAEEAWAAFDKG